MRNRKTFGLLAAMAMTFLLVSTANAQAAQKPDDGKTVADQFKNQPTSDQNQEEDNAKDDVPLSTTSDTVWTFVKVILVLALVIALIYLLLRFINKKTRSFTDGRKVQSIGGINVGSNRSVQLIKVGERIFVIGVGESVSLLKEIDDSGEVEQLQMESEHEDVIDHSMVKFRDWLKKPRKKKDSEPDFKRMLEGKLEQITQERKQAIERMEKKRHEK